MFFKLDKLFYLFVEKNLQPLKLLFGPGQGTRDLTQIALASRNFKFEKRADHSRYAADCARAGATVRNRFNLVAVAQRQGGLQLSKVL